MMTIPETQVISDRLRRHLQVLTVDIGERSIATLANHRRAADYIATCLAEIGLDVQEDPYSFRQHEVANLLAEIPAAHSPCRRYILGAHYDSVVGTVGADDNASAVAVMLEVARCLQEQPGAMAPDIALQCIAFALEEHPAFASGSMGSRVRARRARRDREQIDGMLCLEMVGYTSTEPGSQNYPLPVVFRRFPREGNFIGIVGDLRSFGLTRSLHKAFKRNRDLPVIKLTVPLGGWMLPAVRLSDHSAYWDHGYKAVMITDTAFFRNPNYHTPADTMEKLDYRFMAKLVKSLVGYFRDGRAK